MKLIRLAIACTLLSCNPAKDNEFTIFSFCCQMSTGQADSIKPKEVIQGYWSKKMNSKIPDFEIRDSIFIAYYQNESPSYYIDLSDDSIYIGQSINSQISKGKLNFIHHNKLEISWSTGDKNTYYRCSSD